MRQLPWIHIGGGQHRSAEPDAMRLPRQSWVEERDGQFSIPKFGNGGCGGALPIRRRVVANSAVRGESRQRGAVGQTQGGCTMQQH